MGFWPKCPGCGAAYSVEGSREKGRVEFACESYLVHEPPEFCASPSCLVAQLAAAKALNAELLAAAKALVDEVAGRMNAPAHFMQPKVLDAVRAVIGKIEAE